MLACPHPLPQPGHRHNAQADTEPDDGRTAGCPPTAVANTQGTAQTLPVVATVGDPLVPLDPAAIRLEAPAAATVDGDGTVVVVPGEGGYELDRDGGHRSSARKTHDTDNSDMLITAKEAQRHWGHKWVKPTSFSNRHHRTLSKANWSELL